MGDFLIEWYLWIKVLHVISLISWMAGLLYLPRLFVYHCEAPAGSVQAETFKIMERRLLRAIMNPAMIATWLFGFLLFFTPGLVAWSDGWFHVKFVCVLAMTAIHHVLSRCRKAFAADANPHGARFYRIINELPAVLMVVIVTMVIVKPF